jgi:hypothetical protein
MTLTKSIIVVTPGMSVAGGTTVTLDGSTSTAQDNTTLSGPDAFLFEQVGGCIFWAIFDTTQKGIDIWGADICCQKDSIS